MSQGGAALIVCDPALLAAPETVAIRARFALAGVELIASEPAPTPRALLALMRERRLDPAQTWLITADPSAAAAAGSAGLAGVVVLGDGIDDDGAVLLRHARDLADVPRVLSARGGGCWHQHPA